MRPITRNAPHGRSPEDGFSLIELLTALALVAIVTTLGAGALRNYWLSQSVTAGSNELVGQLRRAQEQAVSETHPKVFGVRLKAGSSAWGIVEYDPTLSTCTQVQTNEFSSGARVRTENFTSTSETTFCKSNLTYSGGATPVPDRATSGYVWFYARGTATPGTVVLENPLVPTNLRTITVSPITGRVTRS